MTYFKELNICHLTPGLAANVFFFLWQNSLIALSQISIHRLLRCCKPTTAMSLQPLFIEISAIVVYVISGTDSAFYPFLGGQ